MQDQTSPQLTSVDICDKLGRRAMARRLRRTVAAVSNAARDGVFPSSWFLVISEMCAEAQIECPRALFAFIPPEAS